MKIAVVSSCFGVELKIPNIISDSNADYHLFTDQSVENNVKGWNIHSNYFNSSISEYNSRRSGKIFKILPEIFLPNYDFYIWHDIGHQLIKEPTKVIKEELKNEYFAVFKHMSRKNSLEEIKFVKKIGFDSKLILNMQLKDYKKHNNLESFGLYALPTFIKANNTFTKKFSIMWWEQIAKYSSRDQISFPFICCKLDYKPKLLKGAAHGENSNDIFEQHYNVKFDRTDNSI